jgi:hypothetical protein
MHTSTISFHEVTSQYPTRSEIKAGIYALNKMSGDLVKIPRDTYAIYNGNYSLYAPASAFPNAVVSKYDEKYADLVKAKEIINQNKWSGDGDELGKAIYLIKRFLDKNAKL